MGLNQAAETMRINIVDTKLGVHIVDPLLVDWVVEKEDWKFNDLYTSLVPWPTRLKSVIPTMNTFKPFGLRD